MESMPRERIRRIIAALSSSDGTLTSRQLAVLLGVSTHTVRNDMKETRACVLQNGADILAKPKRGYVLEVHDEKKWISFCKSCRRMESSDEALAGRNERMHYIMAKLLLNALHSARMTQWEFADDLYIGLSTLKNYWKDMQEILSCYGLSLKADRKGKIRMEGGEKNIRKAVAELLFSTMDAGGTLRNLFYSSIFSTEEIEKVREIVMEAVVRFRVALSDTAFQGIIIHILIILRRLGTRATIEYSVEESAFLKTTKSFAAAQEIVARISEWLHIDIGNEVPYIAEHLVAGERFLQGEDADAGEAQRIVREILSQIQKNYAVSLLEDPELVTGLRIHLEAAIHRLRFNIGIRNEILQVIKKDYPLAFEFAVIASQIVERQTNIKTNENEIGFLAVHFGAAMERKRFQKRVCILVCGTGTTTARLIQEKLLRRFGGYLAIKKVCPLYELSEKDVEEVDFVFSTMPVPFIDSSKILCVSPVLSEKDIEAIDRLLVESRTEEKGGVPETFFHRDLFFPHMEASSREEVLDKLTIAMMKRGYMDAGTRQSVYEREEMSPTEIGALIALPHALESNASSPAIAVAVLEKPIRWVHEMVQVVFLLSIPKEKYEVWEPVFRKIYQYFVRGLGVYELIERPAYDLLLDKLVQ